MIFCQDPSKNSALSFNQVWSKNSTDIGMDQVG